MSTINKKILKRQSLERVYQLAHDAQVPLAIVRWNKHMSQHEDCMCESRMLDQKLCGFCLLSRLQCEALEQNSRTDEHQYMHAAQSISGYLMARHNHSTKLAAE